MEIWQGIWLLACLQLMRKWGPNRELLFLLVCSFLWCLTSIVYAFTFSLLQPR